MLLYMFISVFSFFVGLLVFSSNRKHLLLMLLILEFIVLFLYYTLFIYLMNYESEFYLGMVYLTISVCEGSLGLSVLVSMVRSHGSDYFQSFNFLW